ncbi:hypothetical protein ARMSODRAFT_1011012 [Armillaria solidipes]|uniref:DUF6535 domain-containing protein n=1 Tax=Armillaria solidipes TaxID=1076256 RepID=A0A2H3CQN1_9AGAR|nr:hypothetical protein ARMSODRAFT_1011012 [Armillaria solidipes]
MSTASDPLPGNSGGPAVTKPETTNVEATDNLTEEEDVAAPAQPYAEYVDPAKSRKRFGLKGSAPYRPPKGNDPFNYEEKYPEDAYCEELGSLARVFRTYIDERAIYDANMVEESRDGVDVLLVFAGLFSAVVTTFVAQTSQSLQADYTEMSANLLFEMINIQRAIASGASLDTVTPSPLNPNVTFIASTTSVWVNGLWFTSLALSLTTALVSVLVKQWLHHYMALPSGTPREQSLLRQFRYGGLQKWRVLVIIGLLPVLMHTALAIFFVGLVIFLGPLQDAIAWVVGVITVIAYIAYLMAHILPLFFPQCPYRTSLCDLLHVLYSHVMQYARHFPVSWSTFNTPKWKNLKELESEAVQSVSGELSVEALHWLFSMSSNPTVQSIALQAIGGLHPALQNKATDLFDDIDLEPLLGQCLLSGISRTPVAGLENKLERLLRSNLVLCKWTSFYIRLPETPSVELPPHVVALISRRLFQSSDRDLFIKKLVHNEAMPHSNNESGCFHPLVWINLISDAVSLLEEFPVDIEKDPFAIDLCIAVLPAFKYPPKEDQSDSAKNTAQSSDKAITFHDAIHKYLFKDMTAYLLQVFAVFVHPSKDSSISPSLRILLIFAEFLISRLALKDQVESAAVEVKALSVVFQGIPYHDDFSTLEANTAIFNILDPFITDTMKSVQREADAGLYFHALWVYSKLVPMQWHAISSRSLEVIVNLMFDHYSFKVKDAVFHCAGIIIAKCLHEGSPIMYSVFHTLQCLEYFGHHGYCSWLAEIIEDYLSSFGHHSKSCLEVSVIQEYIEYLHTSDILFNVCSILAVGDLYDSDNKKQIKKNILSLVQIQQDAPAWDECRRRLQQLLEEDGMDFFHLQTYVDGIE